MHTTIPQDEWRAVTEMSRMLGPGDPGTVPSIRLSCARSHRTWEVADSTRAIRLRGGTDLGVYQCMVPPVLVWFATMAADASGGTALDSRIDSDGRCTLTVSSGSHRGEFTHSSPVAPESAVLLMPPADCARVTVPLRELQFLCGLALTRQISPESTEHDSATQPLILSLRNGLLVVTGAWPDDNAACFGISVSTSVSARARVHVVALTDLLDTMRGVKLGVDRGVESDVTVVFPHDDDAPVCFLAGDVTGAVAQPRSHASLARERVERVIEAAFGPAATSRDWRGRYRLADAGVQVCGVLDLCDRPGVLRVLGVLVWQIERTAELLTELNDLNGTHEFVRLAHVSDSSGSRVVAMVDLVAETCIADEVSAAVQCIIELSDGVMPTLAAVFGGQLAGGPADRRWDHYRSTEVVAELIPGELTTLHGPDGVDTWPFDGPVWVITGWNPGGEILDEHTNAQANQQVAADITAHGGRYVHGVGRSAAGDHAEASLVAWGLTRADARRIGQRAGQDAIFELDATMVHLLACAGDRVEVMYRATAGAGFLGKGS